MVPFSSYDCSKCTLFLRDFCPKFKKSTIFKTILKTPHFSHFEQPDPCKNTSRLHDFVVAHAYPLLDQVTPPSRAGPEIRIS
jgi:hypothetical protein